jgi:hypothetical protein
MFLSVNTVLSFCGSLRDRGDTDHLGKICSLLYDVYLFKLFTCIFLCKRCLKLRSLVMLRLEAFITLKMDAGSSSEVLVPSHNLQCTTPQQVVILIRTA